MTTVINTPSNGESTSLGFIVGVLVVIVVLLGLFFVYGLPAIRNNGADKNIDIKVQVPAPTPNQ